MAAWRYEISLLVLKKYFTRSLRSLMKYFSTREEKFRISAQPCNILYLSFLYLGVKAQQYFVSLSDMFIDKKTLLKIWLNPGLNLNIFLGTGMGRQLPL